MYMYYQMVSLLVYVFFFLSDYTFHSRVDDPYFDRTKTGKLSKTQLEIEQRYAQYSQTDKVGNQERTCNKMLLNLRKLLIRGLIVMSIPLSPA